MKEDRKEINYIIYLPSNCIKKNIYHIYLESLQNSNIDPIAYYYFVHLWVEHCPHIKIRKSLTDICNQCANYKRIDEKQILELHFQIAYNERKDFKNCIEIT